MLLLLLASSLAHAAPCTCRVREPVQAVLQRADEVVLATSLSSQVATEMVTSGTEGGGYRTQHRLVVGLRVEENLKGSLQPAAELSATYDELSCLGWSDGRAQPAGLGGLCTGSGRELDQKTSAFFPAARDEAETEGPKLYFLERIESEDGWKLLRVEPGGQRTAVAGISQEDPMTHPLNGRDPRMEAMVWLEGTWSTEGGLDGTTERWTRGEGGRLSGTGTTVKAGKVVFTEKLAIEVIEGVPTYVAWPQGATAATPFAMVEQGPGRLHFSNPAHDWPTDITYTLRADGTIEAKASGGGKESVWELRRMEP